MLAKPKVLFLDDEIDILRAIQDNLRKTNFDVHTATTAEHAFQILKEEDIDIIVSDECMPNMPGHKFLAKAGESYPSTVRLMLSGQAGINEVTSAINDAHIFKFLKKPTRPAELVVALNEAVSIRQLLMDEETKIHHAVSKLHHERKLTENRKRLKHEFKVKREMDTSPKNNSGDTNITQINSYNLSSAIKNKDLSIHFQSIVDPATLKIIAYEASPIWYHPDKGVVYASEIIHLLNGDKELEQFDDWLIEEVCKKKLYWKQRHGRDPIVFIKLSDTYLTSNFVIEKIYRKICDYQISNNTLIFFMSEAFVLTNNELATNLATKFFDIGIHTGIFDASSFLFQEDIHISAAFNLLKVNADLITQMGSSESAKSQTKILIDYAHDLGMKVVAEGAEDPNISKQLNQWGCEFIQARFIHGDHS